MEEKNILINNLRVNFKIAGSGPAILIFHGWGGSSDSWIKVQKILARQGYKVIVPDFPGFGKSKTPKEPWDVGDYMKWTTDFVKFQKLEKFFILAHSFGGRIAIKFALSYPEKIKALILCAAAGIKPKPSLKIRIIYLIAKIGNMIFSPKILLRFKYRAQDLFYLFLRHKDYVKAEGTMRETIKKVIEEDILPVLSQIKPKTLLIWGEKDKMVPVKHGRILKREIKNSELEILPKIGHSPHLETPEKFTEIILNFLKK